MSKTKQKNTEFRYYVSLLKFASNWGKNCDTEALLDFLAREQNISEDLIPQKGELENKFESLYERIQDKTQNSHYSIFTGSGQDIKIGPHHCKGLKACTIYYNNNNNNNNNSNNNNNKRIARAFPCQTCSIALNRCKYKNIKHMHIL